MNKSELVNAVAEKTEGLTKKDTLTAVNAIFEIIADELKKGNEVQLVGFGTFEVRKRAAKQGRNPQNPQKIIKIPAKKVPAFRAGKTLKEAIKALKVGKK